jgi:hypothetical protein
MKKLNKITEKEILKVINGVSGLRTTVNFCLDSNRNLYSTVAMYNEGHTCLTSIKLTDVEYESNSNVLLDYVIDELYERIVEAIDDIIIAENKLKCIKSLTSTYIKGAYNTQQNILFYDDCTKAKRGIESFAKYQIPWHVCDQKQRVIDYIMNN